MQVALAYDHRTTLTSSLSGSKLDLATNLRRSPVSFRGLVKEPVLLRKLLGALHEVILSDWRWIPDEEYRVMLDPVITVHPDQLFFEAFSNDESSYARLSAPFEAFETQGDVQYGTTNIDFTWALRNALQNLRSSRRTLFAVGGDGFGVTTTVGASGSTQAHFERKVDLPNSWLAGFLQVQAALAMRCFTFDVRPVDLLTTIAFWQENNPSDSFADGSRALRYEFQPNKPISIVLEPWEERIVLKETMYEGYERSVRLWGRRRLELLNDVLPYAQKVTIGVLGRGLPHFYICHCGTYQFTLVLSGWTDNDWASGSAFDLLAPPGKPDPEVMNTVYGFLTDHLMASRTQMATETGLEKPPIEHALFQLCRSGRVILDPTTRHYRLRELFAEPLDVESLFTPDPRWQRAKALFEQGNVTTNKIIPPERNSRPETRLEGTVLDDKRYDVIVAIDKEKRLRFARCECSFFQKNIMSRGPCEHILAARLMLDDG